MDSGQRAMIAAEFANLGEGRAKETAGIPAVTQPDAAKMFAVSRDSVQMAAMIERDAPARGMPAQLENGVFEIN